MQRYLIRESYAHYSDLLLTTIIIDYRAQLHSNLAMFYAQFFSRTVRKSTIVVLIRSTMA